AVDPGASPAAARVSFTAGGSNRLFHSQLVNGSGSPVTSTYSWSETTMYSPAWNTSGSYDTFYSFHNTTGKTLNGTLTLLDTTGATASTVALVIRSGETASTNTSTLSVARNSRGTARFTHDGPPRAVLVEAAIANFSLSPAYVQPLKFQAIREAR